MNQLMQSEVDGGALDADGRDGEPLDRSPAVKIKGKGPVRVPEILAISASSRASSVASIH